MHWAWKYIGIPFVDGGRDMAGCDCWGLVRLVLEKQRDIKLPTLAEVSATDTAAIRDQILGRADSCDWVEVVRGNEKPFDVVTMRGHMRGRDRTFVGVECHVGIMVDNRRLMHVEKGIETVCINMDSYLIRDRIRRVFRHRALTP